MKQRLSRMMTQGIPMVFALLIAVLLPANLIAGEARTALRADDGTQPAAVSEAQTPPATESATQTPQEQGETMTVTDTLFILFPVNVGVVQESFSDNARSIRRIKDWIKVYNESDWILNEVLVVGSCSPDGSIAINTRVSSARTKAMLDYCHENIHEFDNINVKTKSLGRDWAGLLRLVKGDPAVPYRNEVIDMLQGFVDEGVDRENTLDEIKALRSGVPYKYMHDKFFDLLRIGYIYVTVTIPIKSLANMTEVQKELIGEEFVPQPEPEPVVVPEPEPAPAPEPEPEPEPECTKCCGKNFYMNVQTNMLYDAALIPNVGVEFYLGKGWSIGGEWKYAFWEKKSKDWFWETYGGDLYVRKWLGKQAKAKPLTGHHLGILGQAITYDYEEGGHKGVQADEHHWNWGASLEYGYSLPITRRLNLDFDIGVGYMGGKYYDYEDINGEFVWVDTKSKHWIGPTKLAVSLIWQIGCGNYNEGKKSSKKK